jgi:hypothetical protein
MAKIIKLSKTEDIAQVIQRIKNLRENEVVFELDQGANLLTNSSNLRLMRKTAEVLGKSVQLKTDDELGKILAAKAGVTLFGQEEAPKLAPARSIRPKTLRTNSSKISDMGMKRMTVKRSASKTLAKSSGGIGRAVSDMAAHVPGVETAKKLMPKMAASAGITMPRLSSKPDVGVKRSWRRDYSKIFLLVVVILIVAVFGAAVLLPQAEVTVYARSEPITRDLEINVDKNIRTVDFGKQNIPGEIVKS